MADFEPTPEQREQVAKAAGGGMPHEEIAIGLGIDVAALDTHFAAELTKGAYAKRMEVLEALHSTALKGNATAARTYLENQPRAAVPPADDDAKKPPLGKKEQAALDAQSAARGTTWDGILPGSATRQ